MIMVKRYKVTIANEFYIDCENENEAEHIAVECFDLGSAEFTIEEDRGE